MSLDEQSWRSHGFRSGSQKHPLHVGKHGWVVMGLAANARRPSDGE